MEAGGESGLRRQQISNVRKAFPKYAFSLRFCASVFEGFLTLPVFGKFHRNEVDRHRYLEEALKNL
jgi:hypothetical protein